MRIRSLVLTAVVVAVGVAVLAHPGHTPIAPPTPHFLASQGTIAFDLFRGSRIFSVGKINGTITELMIDSGAGATTVDQAFAKKLGLPQGEVIDIRGASGAQRARLVKGVTVDFGPLHLTDMTVLVTDLAPVAQAMGRPLPLILGSELFRNSAVTIDFSRQRIRVTRPDMFRPDATAQRNPVASGHSVPSIKLSINGLPPVDADIDLGNSGALLLSHPYWSGQPSLSSLRSAQTMAGGVGGLLPARKVTVPMVNLGGVRLIHVPAVFNESDSALPSTGANLGIELLKSFIVTFDLTHSAFYLQPNPARQPFARDRTGILPQLVGNQLEILYVSPNSPSARAGLVKGDRIVGIGTTKIGPDFYRGQSGNWNLQAPGTRTIVTLADGRKLTITLADYY